MTEEEALALAALIREDRALNLGSDEETSEEAQDIQMAILIKRIADWIQTNL